MRSPCCWHSWLHSSWWRLLSRRLWVPALALLEEDLAQLRTGALDGVLRLLELQLRGATSTRGACCLEQTPMCPSGS